jgi:di/tricarboxylate transporter
MTSQKILTTAIGPLLFVLIWSLNPLGLEILQAKVLGVVVWMLTWWITEIVPMAITSLLPIMLFPMLGVLSLEKTCLSYSNRFVFLFLGGFIIALAMEKWQLHRRLALNIVNRTGTSANRIIFGFFLASFLISMWISNTATTLMMLPIAGSVVALLVNEEKRLEHRGTKKLCDIIDVVYRIWSEHRGHCHHCWLTTQRQYGGYTGQNISLRCHLHGVDEVWITLFNCPARFSLFPDGKSDFSKQAWKIRIGT